MTITRRDIIKFAAAKGTGLAGSLDLRHAHAQGIDTWNAVRDLFALSPDRIHMNAMRSSIIAATSMPIRSTIWKPTATD
jgi:hypothetical protein